MLSFHLVMKHASPDKVPRMDEPRIQPVSRLTRWFSTYVRWGICIAALGWIAYDLDWRELKHAFASANWNWVFLGLLIFGPTPILISQRLRWLLQVHHVDLTLWQAIKVTFAGNFLIQSFPVGTPGGDSAKAWYIARDTPHKHEAALAVFFDRVLGIACLLALSGIIILLDWGNPAFAEWGRLIGVMMVALFLAGGVYYSHRCRRLLRLDAVVARLPLAAHFQRLDRAMFAYRHQVPRIIACTSLTFVLQVTSVISVFLVGRGLGLASDDFWADLWIYLAYTPICFLAGGLPIGAMELTFAEFFADVAHLGTREQAVSLSLVGARLVQLIWSLPGALVVLQGRRTQPITSAEEKVTTVSVDSAHK